MTLGVTTLLHEAYLDISRRESAVFPDRGRFMGYAAKVMRNLIIDYARQASRKKRGGSIQRIPLDGIDVADEERASELVALDNALVGLESFSAHLARVVELRFFGGLSIEETGEVLGLPPHRIKIDWRKARAFLFQAIQDPNQD